jgi:hypothetical protein
MVVKMVMVVKVFRMVKMAKIVHTWDVSFAATIFRDWMEQQHSSGRLVRAGRPAGTGDQSLVAAFPPWSIRFVVLFVIGVQCFVLLQL